MSDVLWELRNASLNGNNARRLDDVTVTIETETTAIIGYSGAGKSSLINVLSGMELPDSGVVTPGSPGDLDRTKFSAPLYWSPQDGGLWPHLTALDHIKVVQGAQTQPNSAKSVKSADNWLELFDLNHRQRAHPGELSKGEQSRLSVARALAADAAVLLMDEPLAHVDPIRTPQYWSIIREHLKVTETVLVFSTHEPAVAISESTNVICLDSGRIQYNGRTEDLYHNPPTEEVARFLGPVNWFAAEDSAMWLSGQELESAKGLRPENVQLQSDEDALLQILSFRFCGSYAETNLKHLPTSSTKKIVHRPAGRNLQDGQLVKLEVIP